MLENLPEKAFGWVIAGGMGLIVCEVIRPLGEAWIYGKATKNIGGLIDEGGAEGRRTIRNGGKAARGLLDVAYTAGKILLLGYVTLELTDRAMQSSLSFLSDNPSLKLALQGTVAVGCASMVCGVAYKAHKMLFSKENQKSPPVKSNIKSSSDFEEYQAKFRENMSYIQSRR